MSNEKAIQIDNLVYYYKSDWTLTKKLALKSLSLEVYEGDAFGFLGPNGAGKTTTIKCILSLIKPHSGNIKIFGKDWRDSSARKLIGYLPEQPYFYDHLTVQETIEMYAHLCGIARAQLKSQVKGVMQRVAIQDKAKSRMRTLSKGLIQRVALAQAIVHNPKLLILDEPFSGLDPIGRKEFRDIIFELKKNGTTIFMSSHILNDVEFICNRAAILVQGELKGIFDLRSLPKLQGTTYEIQIRSPVDVANLFSDICTNISKHDEFMRLIFSDREKAMNALERAVDKNLNLQEFQLQHGSLEDLFMSLVSQK